MVVALFSATQHSTKPSNFVNQQLKVQPIKNNYLTIGFGIRIKGIEIIVAHAHQTLI